MAFTLKDMENQQAEFEAMKEEFSRLQSKGAEVLQKYGVTEAELKLIDLSNLEGDDKILAEKAIQECASSSKAQTKAATESKTSKRKNIVRA